MQRTQGRAPAQTLRETSRRSSGRATRLGPELGCLASFSISSCSSFAESNIASPSLSVTRNAPRTQTHVFVVVLIREISIITTIIIRGHQMHASG